MIKNVIFDIGNVIFNFDVCSVLASFTEDKEEGKFILDNVINSPEWFQYGLIDIGYITWEEAVEIIKDRTNHVRDDLVEGFLKHHNEYGSVNSRVLDLIRKLKDNNYNVYLLSNIDSYTYDYIKTSGLFELVDGYVLSYREHKIKPYIGIYETLIDRYNLEVDKCLFIDDREKNVKTANELGILGKNVIPDNYDSIVRLLDEYNVNYK